MDIPHHVIDPQICSLRNYYCAEQIKEEEEAFFVFTKCLIFIYPRFLFFFVPLRCPFQQKYFLSDDQVAPKEGENQFNK